MQDDALVAALLSSPSTILVGATADGTITRWSRGAAALYGWSEEEILGQPLDLLVPPERRNQLAARERALAGADVPPFETVRITKDGEQVHVDMHLLVVRDGAGRPVGTVALHRELDRVRQVEAALAVSDAERRAGFEDSPVPQSRVDLQGRVLAVNAAMEKLLDEPASDLIGRDALAMYVDTDRPALEAALAGLASGTHNYVQQERTLALRNGQQVPIVMTVTVLTDANGGMLLAGSVEDVSELKATQERSRAQAERLDALLMAAPVAAFSYDPDGRCSWSQGRALAAFGVVDGELVGRSLFDLYDAFPDVGAALRDSLAGRDAEILFEAEHTVWKCHYRARRDEAGTVVGGLGIAVDVTQLATAQREVQANEARMQALLRKAGEIVWVVDRQGRLLWVSPAVQSVLGWEPTALFWRPTQDLIVPEDVPGVAETWLQVLAGQQPREPRTCRLVHADGTLRWFDYSFTDLTADPDIGGVVVNLRDVTERRAAEHELQRLALHDPMTGLANRAFLLDRAGQAMVRSREQGRQVGLVLLGVTDMGRINETYGHEIGDVVLCSVAGRLLESVRSADSVARSGGDRFAVLVQDVASAEELRARATGLVEQLQGRLELGDVGVEVGIRVGTALTPAADAGALLAAAERSYDRERSNASSVLLAPAAVEQDAERDRQAASDLRLAVDHDQLRLHFQPIMDLATGEMSGAEALVRWQHPTRGLLAPAEFIPLAESSGLIVDVGEWVLREACAQAARWQRYGRPFGVGINLSPRQMVGGGFADVVREVLRETGAQADRLVLEVTESAVMDAPDAGDVLHELRALGVKLALDDFGTGYSSLTYLRRFPIDAIKIDRSFVSGLGRNADDDAIVASVVSLGRAVGKLLVAEGVETPAQLGALRALGVEQAQGFLWSPGLPPEELTDWLDDHERRPAPSTAPRPVRAEQPGGSSGRAVERILALHEEGASLHTIAAALNAEGLRTEAGPRWTTTTVARVVAAVRPPV